jgi:hypothetical protein
MARTRGIMMTPRRGVDTKALLQRALSSGSKEAFTVIAREGCYRIAAGTRISISGRPRHFIEVVVGLSPSLKKVDLPLMERKLAVLRQLEARGYSLVCQDGLDILCEAEEPAERLDEEIRKVESILSWTLSDHCRKSLTTHKTWVARLPIP